MKSGRADIRAGVALLLLEVNQRRESVPVRTQAIARSATDAATRLVLRCAYQGARLWWRLRRPPHRGALAAIWHGGRLLLVRTSYRPRLWSLPGGGVQRGEHPAAAAARECREEIGLLLDTAALRLALAHSAFWEGRPDSVHVFEAILPTQPAIAIDNREIVAAEFVTPAEALGRALTPHVREYLERRAGRRT
jgi:8-oxo-dGTP pyrophosphatase MutT (NUDIX family)